MNETVAPKLSPKPEDVRALRRWLSQIYMDWTLKKTGVAWSDHAADLIITRYGALPSKPKDENALLNSIKREINALQEGVGVVVRLCDQMNYSVGKGVTIQTTLTPEQQAVLDAAQAYRDEPRGGNYKTGLWSCLMGKVMKLPATVVMDPVQVGIGWRPISEAGTEPIIGLLEAGLVFKMHWQSYYDKWPQEAGGPTYRHRWTLQDCGAVYPCSPTHFMPLPALPEADDAG